MTAKIILNPYAGRWKGLQKRDEIEIRHEIRRDRFRAGHDRSSQSWN